MVNVMKFIEFRDLIAKQITYMLADERQLFKVAVDPDLIYKTYLDSFSPEDNPIFRERTEHDCSCCKNFIRKAGAIVVIDGGKLASIWDIEIEGKYKPVVEALSKLIKSNPIENIYYTDQKILGMDHNLKLDGIKTRQWDHFHYVLPSKYQKNDAGEALSHAKADKEVLTASMSITNDAINTVLEIIDTGLYKGVEYKDKVLALRKTKEIYSESPTELMLWRLASDLGSQARFKNSVIGTLLVDLSGGMELEAAVKRYESKVAPQNYKRSSALITQSMIDRATESIRNLGLEDALTRRYGTVSDLTINNVIFADRSVRPAMGALDMLAPTKAVNVSTKISDVGIVDFMENILPGSESIEVMLNNNQESNLVSLIAPENQTKNILKWKNNFSWSYNGNITDSMSQQVREHGGKTDGVLRFSIQWNDEGNNNIDLDAHAFESTGNHIYFRNKGQRHRSSGMLDVDIRYPHGRIAVENIIYTDPRKLPSGIGFNVHNFECGRSRAGFTAEIEFNGNIHSFYYEKPLEGKEFVRVATVTVNGGSISMETHLDGQQKIKRIWGIQTNQWQKVSTIMLSPNHWDGQSAGNKHWFFMLENCINPEPSRGLYNEFLTPSLHEHRKVLEVLSSKLKTKPCDQQLSGLGFSSTIRNELVCRVKGKINQTINIKF